MRSFKNDLLRTARDHPGLRSLLLPSIKTAMTFPTENARKKYLKEHPKADKSKHTVKPKGKDTPKKDTDPKILFSEKHKIHLKGVTPKELDEFLDSDIGKELQSSYKLKVIAGQDFVLTRAGLDRAKNVLTKMRDAHVRKDLKKKDVCEDSGLAPGWDGICADNLGVERASMPQFTTKPVAQMRKALTDERYKEIQKLRKEGKGDTVSREEMDNFYDKDNAETAIAAGADPDSEESTFDTFVSQLKKEGVKVKDKTKRGVRVGDLSATQSEIQAGKVFENAEKHLKGEKENTGPVYITSDGHILDGHHRWAGILTANPDARIPAIEIDMPMKEMLRRSHESPGVFRQNFRFEVVGHEEPLDLGFEPGETWQQRGKWYAKGPEKDAKASGPFKNKKAAEVHAEGPGKTHKTAFDWYLDNGL